jgi:hypothetical protein
MKKTLNRRRREVKMEKDNELKLFENKKIRAKWDDE